MPQEQWRQDPEDLLVTLSVWMIELRHQQRSITRVVLECRQAVSHRNLVRCAEASNHGCLLLQWVFRKSRGCVQVPRRGQEHGARACGTRLLDHGLKVSSRFLELQPPVIEAEINEDYPRMVVNGVAPEAREPLGGVFSPNPGGNDIQNSMRVRVCQCVLKKPGVGILLMNAGRNSVACGNAVTKCNDVHGLVGRPFLVKVPDNSRQAGHAALGRRGRPGGIRSGVQREPHR